MVRRQEEGAGVAGKRDKWQVNKLEKSHSMRVAERVRERGEVGVGGVWCTHRICQVVVASR